MITARRVRARARPARCDSVTRACEDGSRGPPDSTSNRAADGSGTSEPVDGRPVFTDGPSVETKKHLGGFVVVDVPDELRRGYWTGRLATMLDWPQEVHRFRGPGQARRNGPGEK
ncbi:YciI family protein [Micromonospora chersina]|uniref:hypothetical protein n=1 Tax=Micromonospora chersina TaxID=47854 RepID=UPI00371C9939